LIVKTPEVIDPEVIVTNASKGFEMIVEGEVRCDEFPVKRCNLPGLVLKTICPNCQEEVVHDLARDHYVSYPIIGQPFNYDWYCGKCEYEWSELVQVSDPLTGNYTKGKLGWMQVDHFDVEPEFYVELYVYSEDSVDLFFKTPGFVAKGVAWEPLEYEFDVPEGVTTVMTRIYFRCPERERDSRNRTGLKITDFYVTLS